MDKKMKEKKLVDYSSSLEARVAVLENKTESIGETLRRLESKIDAGFARIDTKLDRLEDKMDKKFDKAYSCMKWMAVTAMGLFGGILTIISRGFHWV